MVQNIQQFKILTPDQIDDLSYCRSDKQTTVFSLELDIWPEQKDSAPSHHSCSSLVVGDSPCKEY
uniref:Uncharacterized protein n=1 Tax=Glossina morsitans morsitans TaxID=37546 RepID=A0A1B0G8W4_GLOMM